LPRGTGADVTHVAFTPYDFRITSVLPAAVLEAMVKVILPPAPVEPLMDVLRVEFDRFVEEFGAPRPSVKVSTGQS
jgi:hypothetical protein